MSQAPTPPRSVDPDALAHDQLRDARDGIERSARSDKGQRLPHERDESPVEPSTGEQAASASREVVEQAAEDVERGLEDTEARGTPSNPPSAKDNRSDDESGDRAQDHAHSSRKSR